MNRTIGRHLAATLLVLACAAGCTTGERSGRPLQDGRTSGSSTSTPAHSLPEIELPAAAPSCVFHGLSFGLANLANNPLGAENVELSVAWAQEWLRRLPSEGGGTPGLRRHGQFDRLTEEAVKHFQAVANFAVVDGLVGNETWLALGRAVGGCRDEQAPSCEYLGLPVDATVIDPTRNRVGAEDAREDVLQVQRWWNGLPADYRHRQPNLTLEETGWFDGKTTLAVTEFQADVELRRDGEVGHMTWHALAAMAGVCGY